MAAAKLTTVATNGGKDGNWHEGQRSEARGPVVQRVEARGERPPAIAAVWLAVTASSCPTLQQTGLASAPACRAALAPATNARIGPPTKDRSCVQVRNLRGEE